MSIEEQIKTLKKERQAIILAHNYTMADVQDIADFVGDSLELSRKAAECHAPVIVFCGVRFMAETAKILSPESIVLHPNPHAGCPMADMATASAIQEYKKTHAGTTVVAYVNTTAETKTAVDICCTSGNAEKVIESIPPEKDILFLPDRNLGANLSAKLGRKMDLWAGFCPTHNKIMPEHILQAKALHPQAVVIVHPDWRTRRFPRAACCGSRGNRTRGNSSSERNAASSIACARRIRARCSIRWSPPSSART